MPSERRLLATIGSLALLPLVLYALWMLFKPDPAPADGKVHIRYWEKWTGFEEDAMRKVVDTFNQRSDRVHVEYLAVSQVNQKMLLATAGGHPPDVAGVWDYDLVTFADDNARRPLHDYCRRSDLGAKDYLKAYWDRCQHRGHTYAMPTTPAAVALHWNRKLFREAGLDPDRPPRTIEELDTMSDKL